MSKPKHVHRPDMPAGFRMAACKEWHSAIYQRKCADCTRWFCAQCAGIELWPEAQS